MQITDILKNECWINALYEIYGDSLLRTNKQQRYVITRAKILEIIGKTEENVKEGITWKEILPFFVKYDIKARIFDQYMKLKHYYDPPKENHHNYAFYAMYDDDHVYTLNHNLNKLNQHLDSDEDNKSYIVSCSNDYYINEDRTASKYKMIESIDDIVKIAKEVSANQENSENKETTYMIHKHDDLEYLLWQFCDAGYTPQIKFMTGQITHLVIELNGFIFSIKCQQLNHEEIDGMVDIQKEDVYNRMEEAQVEMSKTLFRKEHRSYYSQEDINILDEYRTVANVGIMKDITRIKPSDLAEVDQSKAYTHAFMNIENIPIF